MSNRQLFPTRRSGTRGAGRPGARGQALVEFSLVIPLFLLLFLALFDLGRAVFSYNALTNAAREGARVAIVNQDLTTIVERAQRQAAMVEINDPSVAVGFFEMAPDGTPDLSDECDPVAVGCLAVVSFEATYRPITPLVGDIIFGSGVDFRAESVLSIEYRCPNADFPSADLCPRQP